MVLVVQIRGLPDGNLVYFKNGKNIILDPLALRVILIESILARSLEGFAGANPIASP